MSDKLKTYIQQSKSKFDSKLPKPDLFDKIMEGYESKHLKTHRPFKSTKIIIKWMAVAASLSLVIICGKFLMFPDQQFPNSRQSAFHTKQIINTASTINTIIGEKQLNEKVAIENKPDRKMSKQAVITTEATEIITNQRNLTTKNKQLNVSSENNENHDSPHLLVQMNDDSKLQDSSQNKSDKVSTASYEKLDADPAHLVESANQSSIASHPTQDQQPGETVTQVDEELEVDTEVPAAEFQSLSSVIKKGLFGFLFKKAKKWSGNTLTLETKETEHKQILAVHFETEKLEFSKEIKIKNTKD